MHSSHYASFTIHYNGGYDGDFIVADVRRNKQGENISGTGVNDYKEIKIYCQTFFKVAKQIIESGKINFKDTLDFILKGKNPENDEHSSIQVNSGEIVDFYLNKLRDEEIEKLEQMEFRKLLKRYSK